MKVPSNTFSPGLEKKLSLLFSLYLFYSILETAYLLIKRTEISNFYMSLSGLIIDIFILFNVIMMIVYTHRFKTSGFFRKIVYFSMTLLVIHTFTDYFKNNLTLLITLIISILLTGIVFLNYIKLLQYYKKIGA
jgi:hypothetical protein